MDLFASCTEASLPLVAFIACGGGAMEERGCSPRAFHCSWVGRAAKGFPRQQSRSDRCEYESHFVLDSRAVAISGWLAVLSG